MIDPIILVILISYFIISLIYEWIYRKIIALIQGRMGPGILQPLTDLIKLLGKGDGYNPDFFVGLVALALTTLSLCLLPFQNPILKSEFSLLTLFAFVITESVIIFLSALKSGRAHLTKKSILTNLVVTLKLPLILSLFAVGVRTKTFDLLVLAQTPNAISAPLAFLAFLLALFAETSLAPLETLQPESELVAGWFSGLRGRKFAIFLLNQNLKQVLLAFVSTTVFLGGGDLPAFITKSTLTLVLMAFFRGISGRLRMDQMAAIIVKYGIPLTILQLIIP